MSIQKTLFAPADNMRGICPQNTLPAPVGILTGAAGVSIWAKTFPHTAEIKTLTAHLLDVAAVAKALQEAAPNRVEREAKLLRVDANDLLCLRVWMAALHDLGKCSAAFQGKSEDNWPAKLFGPYRKVHDPGHWRSTATLLRHKSIWSEVQKVLPGVDRQALRNLLSASVGHHGRPPDQEDWERQIEPAIGAPALAEALRILQSITTLLPPPGSVRLSRAASKALSWQASGLITLADWVGSDATFFGPGGPGELAAYFDNAQDMALQALASKGLLPQRVTSRPGLGSVAPSIARPHPMQQWADTVSIPDDPCLAVIEDVTGSGKTEAALTLACRMMASGKGEGLYFALPTEATSNAMFDRLQMAFRGFFAPGAKPSLVLSHGRAHLSEPFAEVRRAPPDTAEAQCNAWIADHRRKAFFADIGAGTIDQAFLTILPKRHLTLRQYGLAGRILVVDEAHAYDAYMEEELTRLLEAHALTGGSAIVLSATLPMAKRRSMLRVYHAATEPSVKGFPLATIASGATLTETAIAASPGGYRKVDVQRMGAIEDMHRKAGEAAARGAAVLVLRNSVDEAVTSAQTLQAAGNNVDLFHARFAQADRTEIEDRVLARFGKDGPTEERRGQILVATQVVEQSLDVDFDVIFTDLAPVDLIVQRAGRLWRHQRDCRPVGAPVLHVLSPDPGTCDGPDWLLPVLGRSAHVYRNPSVMWRSARVLFGAGHIETPAGLRALIEAVYGPDAAPIPAGLDRAALDAEGIERGNRALGRLNTIDLSEGYGGLGGLSIDQEVGTRLGEDVRALRLARYARGAIQPWVDGPQAWARSELRVRASWLLGASEPLGLQDAITAVKADWPDWEREPGGPLIGIVNAAGSILLEGGNTTLCYDSTQGLIRETS